MRVNKFIISVVIFLTVIHWVYAKTFFYDANTYNVKFTFGKTTGSSFYDVNGNIISELERPDLEDETQKYRFNYFEYLYDLDFSYHLTGNFFLKFTIPLKYYTLTEIADTIYFIDDNNQYKKKITIGEYSLFQPEYFKISSIYSFYKKDSSLIATKLELLIPPGFHNGLYNDPDYNFLSDGAFQFNLGMIFLKDFKKGWIESQLEYHYRTEDFEDEIRIFTEAGLSTVPGTALTLSLEFLQSLGNFSYAKDFNPRETIAQSNNFNIGFSFLIFLSDNVYTDFSYKVNLLGKNTWNLGGYFIDLGIKL